MDNTVDLPEQTRFIFWLASVLDEGQTLLVGTQVPKKDADGNLQYYPNGMIQASWPAKRPNLRATKPMTGACYINTGIFSDELMGKDRVSASYTNCVGVTFLLLDDIGSKVPIKNMKLEPSWAIESSPGNFQYCYAYSHPVTPAEHCALFNALARNNLTDPGASNAVRWARLPGSLNLKPERNGWESKLISWSKNEYSIAQIVEAFGIEITDADRRKTPSGSRAAVKLQDDGNDNVLKWLSENDYVFSSANGEGWYDVLCPNADSHSDGSPAGRYLPSSRSFKCFHGHCDHIHSEEFLAWVEDQGGPSEMPGPRQELVSNVMAKAIDKLNMIYEKQIKPAQDAGALPRDTLINDVNRQEAARVAQQAAAEEAEREAGRLARENWFQRYAYLETGDCYFDMVARRALTRANFDARYRHVGCRSRHGRAPVINASKWFDENREDNGGHSFRNMTYSPGNPTVMYVQGDKYGNLWVDARPTGRRGRVHVWLRHLKRLVPDRIERHTLIWWMAFKVQNPGVKINWQLYLASDPGAGKDTLLEAFLYAVSGRPQAVGRSNSTICAIEELLGNFNYQLNNEVIFVNEVREPSNYEKRQVENKLKPFCAAPPLTLQVNLKHMAPYNVVNQASMVFMSNYRDGLTLPHDDRRYFCIWSERSKMSEAEAKIIWDWYDNGGLDYVAHFLGRLDLSKFNAKGNAPWTEHKRLMCDESLTDAESVILHQIAEKQGVFAQGVVMGPFDALVSQLRGQTDPLVANKMNVKALQAALKAAGWKDLGMVSARKPGEKTMLTPKRIFRAEDSPHARKSKSELRQTAEDLMKPSSVSAKIIEMTAGKNKTSEKVIDKSAKP